MLYGEQEAVEVLNAEGTGQVVLLCEHASKFIPESLNALGLSAEQLSSHVVWDPGAYALARRLSLRLQAPLVASGVSRLVYDCNRPPDVDSAIPTRSELIDVPGNVDLDDTARQARVDRVYKPFCSAVDQLLERRVAADPHTAVVTIHSFTPVYFGQQRAVEIGLLHDEDSRLVDQMLAQKAQLPHRYIQRNAPYGPQDGVTHSLQRHALPRALLNVMIEVRNDLLVDDQGVEQIAEELLTLLQPALQALCSEDRDA